MSDPTSVAVALVAAAALSSGGSFYPVTKKGDEFSVSYTWNGYYTGEALGHGGTVTDDYLFPTLPAGKLYYLQSCKIVNEITNAVDWDQDSFCYNKVLNAGVKEANSPNLDVLCTRKVLAKQTGTFSEQWGFPTQYEQPLPMTSSIQAQYGGTLAPGNTATITLTFIDGGEATEIRWTGSQKTMDGFAVESPIVPAGSEWLITTAFMQGNVTYKGTITNIANQRLLCTHPAATIGSQASGGYGSNQSSDPLGGYAEVWDDYIHAKEAAQLGFDCTALGNIETTIAWLVMAAQVPS